MNKGLQSKNRAMRIRRKVKLVSDRLRLSIFRSNKYLYAQIIDDVKGQTLSSVSEKLLDKKDSLKFDHAREMGKLIAKLAKEKKITKVVFDKGRYAYHGKVKAFADGAREGGLQF